MKATLRKFTRLGPVKAVVRCMLFAADGLSRLTSVLRTAAIFRGPELPFCHWSVTVKYPENVRCGAQVVIGPNTTLGAKGGITLGDHVRLSEGVLIETAGLDYCGAPPYPHIAKPIVLERGVWVGAKAVILGGVTIGAGSVVGAGVVVARSVPPDTIVVGAERRLRPKQPT